MYSPLRHTRALFVAVATAVVLTMASTSESFGQRTPVLGPPPLGFTWAEPEKGQIVVEEVTPATDIAKAGLMTGDVVLAIDGKKLTGGQQMDQLIRRVTPRKKVTIRVERKGKPLELVYLASDPIPVKDAKVGIFGAMLQLDEQGRIQIAEVKPDTPAAKAGLKSGDILLSIGRQTIDSLTAAADLAARQTTTKKTGDKIDLRIVRSDKEQPIILVLGESLSAAATPTAPSVQVVDQVPVVLGVAVQERGDNVIVTQVIPNEPAAKAGVQPGDVILALGQQRIVSYATLARTIKAFKPGDKVAVQTQRGDETGVIEVVVATRKSAVADVVLDSHQDIAEIVAEVKILQVQVSDLSKIVEQLSKELAQLKAGK